MMTRYDYFRLTGPLCAALLLSLAATAQSLADTASIAASSAASSAPVASSASALRTDTPAAAERLEIENLHFAHSENASGIPLDGMGYYSRVGLGFGREKGSLKRVQEGANNTSYRFETDGGGPLGRQGGAYVWGRFAYTRTNLRDAAYNATLFDPLRGTPFYIADTHKSRWINQLFDMEVRAATPLLWRRLTLGLSVGYQNGQAAKQLDPRPLTSLSKFEIRPGLTVRLGGGHHLGVYGRYHSRREDGSASNSVTLVNQPVYIMSFPGFFIDAEIGGLNGDNLRIYNANCMGIGGDYTFRHERLTVLLTGEFSREAEDVTNSYTTPKMVGTTLDDRYSVGLHASFRPSGNDALFLSLIGSGRSIDGIQYVQEYDNSFEVAKWIIRSKSIRSNSTRTHLRGEFRYMRTTRGRGYDWMVGGVVSGDGYDDIYYIPRSTQRVENLGAELFGRKNFRLGGRHTLLVGLRASVRRNLDRAIDYNGYKAATECYRDFTLRDFHSLGTGCLGGGATLTYSVSRISRGRGSFFVTAAADYLKATEYRELFDDRLLLDFKLGLLF